MPAATSAPLQLHLQDAAPRLDYVPALDGLRALAIGLVVAFNAGMPPFWSGFVGVWLFFVLSGYLITLLVLERLAREGGRGLGAFYVRRFERLFPPLLLMLAAYAAFHLAYDGVEAWRPIASRACTCRLDSTSGRAVRRRLPSVCSPKPWPWRAAGGASRCVTCNAPTTAGDQAASRTRESTRRAVAAPRSAAANESSPATAGSTRTRSTSVRTSASVRSDTSTRRSAVMGPS